MAEQPEEVDVVHHIAAEIVREEVETKITIEGEKGGRERQRRHREDHQDRGAERGPAEQRHAREMHPRAPLLVDRRGEVQPGESRAQGGQGNRPDPVIRADTGLERGLRVWG